MLSHTEDPAKYVIKQALNKKMKIQDKLKDKKYWLNLLSLSNLLRN